MSNTVKRMIAHFGYDQIEDGDVLLTNDAYITGSHLNHMTFVVPVFFEGEIVGFSACMAHWQDIGGTLDGMTFDIFSEGLQMPIVKIYRKGVPNAEIFQIIEINVRIPERAMGDLRAQIAAVKTGERRVLEMLHKYGHDYKVIFVGDATMSPYEITYPGGSVEHWNEEAGAVWLDRVTQIYPSTVWLNPTAERHWDYTPSVGVMKQLVSDRMYPLTIEGLDKAMRELVRG
jgi:hypothetical protein